MAGKEDDEDYSECEALVNTFMPFPPGYDEAWNFHLRHHHAREQQRS